MFRRKCCLAGGRDLEQIWGSGPEDSAASELPPWQFFAEGGLAPVITAMLFWSGITCLCVALMRTLLHGVYIQFFAEFYWVGRD